MNFVLWYEHTGCRHCYVVEQGWNQNQNWNPNRNQTGTKPEPELNRNWTGTEPEPEPEELNRLWWLSDWITTES
jgi:hypothetical protein